MAEDPTDTITETATPDSAAPQQLENISATFTPAGRLDADLYNAEDLDGVTESLFGSGNLNYMMLQARQNDLATGGNGFDIDLSQSPESNAAGLQAAVSAAQANAAATAAALQSPLAAGEDSARDAIEAAARAGGAADSGNRGLETISYNNFGNIQDITDLSDTRIGRDGAAGSNGDGGLNGNNGNNGDPGPQGPQGPQGPGGPGGPGDPPGGDDDFDLVETNNIGLPNIDVVLDPLEEILGDIDLGIGLGLGDGIVIDLDTVLADIPLIKETITLDLPVVQPLVDDVINALSPVIENLGLPDIPNGLAPFTAEVLNNPFETVENLLDGLLQPSAGDTDLEILTNLGLPDIVAGLDPVEALLGDIDLGIGLDLTENGATIGLDTVLLGAQIIQQDIPVDLDMLGGLLQDPLGGLLNPEAGDTDLSLLTNLGLPEVAVGLDPVEQILGDIDLGIGLTATDTGVALALDTLLLNQQILDHEIPVDIANLESLLQDPLGGILNPEAGDIDLSLGGNVLTDTLGLGDINVGLDPVEQILGDIDIVADLNEAQESLNLALDTVLLGSDALGGDVDLPLTPSDIGDVTQLVDNVWPDLDSGGMADVLGMTADIGDALGNVVDSALPEPVGNIVEGLGLLGGGDGGGGLLSGLNTQGGWGLFG